MCIVPRQPNGLPLVAAFLLWAWCVLGPSPLLRAQSLSAPTNLQVADGYRAVQWTARDGLPVDAVNGMARGPDGYLWATTYDGLVRFDGVRFTTLRTDTHPAFPSNRFVQLVRGPDDALWMTTEQPVLVRYDPRTDAVRTVRYRPDPTASSVHLTYVRVVDETLWVGSQRGLLRVEWTEAPSGASVPRLLPVGPRHGAIVGMAARGDTLWVMNSTSGLWQFVNGRLQRVPFATADQPNRPKRFTVDAQGRLWLLGDDALYGRRATGDSLRRVGPVPTRQRGWIGHLLPVPDGSLYLTMDAGTFRFASDDLAAWRTTGRPARPMWMPSRTSTNSVRHALERPHQITTPNGHWQAIGASPLHPGATIFHNETPVLHTSGPINGLLHDGEGHVWVASGTAGLIRIAPTPIRSYGTSEGMTVANTYPVVPDPRAPDAVWAGTLMGDALVHLQGDVVTSYDTSPARVVWSILPRPDGTVWLGTGQGIVALDPSAPSNRVTRPPGLPPALQQPNTRIRALFQDRSGAVWVGRSGILHRLQAGRWTRFDTSDGLPDAPIRVFGETHDGTLWMGTNGGGLVRYHPPTDTSAARFSTLTTANGLSSTLIRSLYEAPDHTLWIGTEDRGLIRLSQRDTVAVTTADGLFANSIHQILPDDEGRLWMSSNQGLFWVSYDALQAVADGEADHLFPTAYTEHHGLRSREANGGVHSAGTRTASGHLWFPSQAGVVRIDASRVRNGPRQHPTAVLEAVDVDGQPHPLRGHALSLAPDDREVAIRYTGISFYRPERVRFRYRLIGEAWTEAGTRRVAYFTNLDPGTHTFEVQATHGDGAWTTAPAQLTLVVDPEWWETWWFLALALFAGGGLILGVAWGRVRWLEAQRRHLRQVVEARTEEIRTKNERLQRQSNQLAEQAEQLQEVDAAKSRFFANISHELRTPLTLILGPVRWLRQQQQVESLVGDALALIEHHAVRLQRLVDQLLELAQLDVGILRIQARPVPLPQTAERLAQSFATWAAEEAITLTFDHQPVQASGTSDAAPPFLPPSLPPVYADPQHLEQIISNLLANAIKYTPRGGHVHLLVDETDTHIRLTVADNGPGMDEDDRATAFDRFVQGGHAETTSGAGLGLSLTRDLVDLHGGSLTLDSTPGEGTRATVSLRRGHDHLAPDQLAMTPGDAPDDASGDPPDDGLEGQSGDGASQTTQTTAPRPVEATRDQQAAPPVSDASMAGDGAATDERLILVVDDHASVRQHVRQVLGNTFRIAEATNGTEGMERAQTLLPDLILADVMMPEMDGLTLTRTLKDMPETAAIPILLLTARGGTDAEVEGLHIGADDYLTKPFDPRVLQARIHGIFALQERLRKRLEAERQTTASDSSKKSEASSEQAPHTAAVRDLVHQHLSDPDLTVTRIASALDTTRSTLYRRLRSEGSPSPSTLIRTVRLEEAARLLSASEGSVTEVAYAVGYENLAAFSRAFREHFGHAPSECIPSS